MIIIIVFLQKKIPHTRSVPIYTWHGMPYNFFNTFWRSCRVANVKVSDKLSDDKKYDIWLDRQKKMSRFAFFVMSSCLFYKIYITSHLHNFSFDIFQIFIQKYIALFALFSLHIFVVKKNKQTKRQDNRKYLNWRGGHHLSIQSNCTSERKKLEGCFLPLDFFSVVNEPAKMSPKQKKSERANKIKKDETKRFLFLYKVVRERENAAHYFSVTVELSLGPPGFLVYTSIKAKQPKKEEGVAQWTNTWTF